MGHDGVFFLRLAGIAVHVDVTLTGTAIVLIAWGIFTAYATVASFKRPWAISWVLITLPILFILLAISKFVAFVHTIKLQRGPMLVDRVVRFSSHSDHPPNRRMILPLGERRTTTGPWLEQLCSHALRVGTY